MSAAAAVVCIYCEGWTCRRCTTFVPARPPLALEPPLPICSVCNDSHVMPLGEREVSCTHCPVPCKHCRGGGFGSYCASTPCRCACHVIARAARLAP